MRFLSAVLIMLGLCYAQAQTTIVPGPTVTDGSYDYTWVNAQNYYTQAAGSQNELSSFLIYNDGAFSSPYVGPTPLFYGTSASEPSTVGTSTSTPIPGVPYIPGTLWSNYVDAATQIFVSGSGNQFYPTTTGIDGWPVSVLPPIQPYPYLIIVTPVGTAGGVGLVYSPTTGGSGLGDPQFSGLQGQNFQFHGMADEVFSLVSSPELQLNSLFKFISSGTCDYNNTVCWSHPGTYLGQIGIQFGSQKVTLQSASHSAGLTLLVNDKVITVSAHVHIYHGLNNQTMTIVYKQNDEVVISTNGLYFKIVNSDYFFNMDFGVRDSSIIQKGATHLSIKGEVCEVESRSVQTTRNGAIQAKLKATYPNIPLHGLLGQTWRNAVFCGRYFEGNVDDYVTSGLFSNEHTFNYFKSL
jgi:hypothetical protein